MAGTSLRQLQQRIASRPIQAGQAHRRRRDAAFLRKCTPLRFGEPALHARDPRGVRYAGFVDPAAGPVGVHRGRRQIANPAQRRTGLQCRQQQAQCRIAFSIGWHAAQHGVGLCDFVEQGR
ncbi:hypothetical protein G6F22_011952 [Rhizopus arrhizus]|nr:hypothetical protein G6F22_011952 [Rhizopus arrhizus]